MRINPFGKKKIISQSVPVQELKKVARVGRKEPSFTTEEKALKSLFGGGGKIWGFQNQPVQINHDLNCRMRGDNSTGELFFSETEDTKSLFGFGSR